MEVEALGVLLGFFLSVPSPSPSISFSSPIFPSLSPIVLPTTSYAFFTTAGN